MPPAPKLESRTPLGASRATKPYVGASGSPESLPARPATRIAPVGAIARPPVDVSVRLQPSTDTAAPPPVPKLASRLPSGLSRTTLVSVRQAASLVAHAEATVPATTILPPLSTATAPAHEAASGHGAGTLTMPSASKLASSAPSDVKRKTARSAPLNPAPTSLPSACRAIQSIPLSRVPEGSIHIPPNVGSSVPAASTRTRKICDSVEVRRLLAPGAVW